MSSRSNTGRATSRGNASVTDLTLNTVPLASANIRRNVKGGVLISPAEIRQTLDFFDTAGKGYITMQDLRDKLGIFYSRLTSMDYKFLMNGKTELTEQDLAQLLMNNELTDFDPVREAFKVYSPNEDYVDPTILKNILSNLGFHDINDDDVEVLMRAMDFDQDDEISLDDFRMIAESGFSGATTSSSSSSGVVRRTNVSTSQAAATAAGASSSSSSSSLARNIPPRAQTSRAAPPLRSSLKSSNPITKR